MLPNNEKETPMAGLRKFFKTTQLYHIQAKWKKSVFALLNICHILQCEKVEVDRPRGKWFESESAIICRLHSFDTERVLPAITE